MNTYKQRQNRSISLQEQKIRKIEHEEDYDSSSTLQNTPIHEFAKLRSIIYNFFQLAKSELSGIYQFVLNELNLIGKKVSNQSRGTQNLLEWMSDLRKQTQTAMSEFPSRLLNILIIPKIIRPSLNTSIQQIQRKEIIKSPQSKKKVSYNSSNNIQIEVTQLNLNNNKLQVKKISNANFKNVENLQFLQGCWPSLQSIHLSNKRISSLCQFQQLIAKNLQQINLSENQISELRNFKKSEYPYLTILNLKKNKIKSIQGLEQARFPQLKILNLSNNLINKILNIKRCCFPQLLELNLQQNKLMNVQALNGTQFVNLQILNLDSNRLDSLESLRNSHYDKLKVLSFSNNNITSLQFLDRMPLRRLQALIGHNNKIKSLQPLINKQMPALNQIVLHNNEISNLNFIKQMNFPVLTEFDLQFNKIRPRTLGCFIISGKGYKDALKKFPFLLI